MRGSTLVRSSALVAAAALTTAGLSVAVVPTAGATPVTPHLAKGTVLIAQEYDSGGGGGSIRAVAPDGTASTLTSNGQESMFAVAVDRDQNVYYTELNGRVAKVAPDGTTTTIATGTGEPDGIGVDSTGNVYVTSFDNGTLTRYGPNGTSTIVLSGLSSTIGLAVDSSDNVYIDQNVYNGNSVDRSITKVAPNGTSSSLATAVGPTSAGYDRIFGLAVGPTGTVYAALEGGGVYAVTQAGQVSAFSSGQASQGVAVDDAGNVYRSDAATRSVVRYNSAGGNATTVASGLSSNVGIAVVSKGAQNVAFSSTTPTSAHPNGTYTPTLTAGASSAAPQVSASGACTYDATSGAVTFGHPGACTVSADQAGDADYFDSPTATQTITVTPIAQTLTFGTAPSSSASVVGNHASVSATSDGTSNAISFSRDAASDDACTVSTSGSVIFTHPGNCLVAADQTGDTDHSAGHQTLSIPVAQAATAMTLATTPTSVSSTVTVTSPGAGSPTGSVQFSLGGQPIGSPVALSNGTATLQYAVPSGQAQQVSAAYSGDGDFLGQSASLTRHDPSVTATVNPTGASRWSRGPVTVSFACTTAGAALTAACPSPVVLDHDGAGQSVTRTIQATDGGVATVNVAGIDIDATNPTAQLSGARDGAYYFGVTRTPSCSASDATSGPAGCTVTTSRDGDTVSYTTTATDVAGNVTTGHGSFVTSDVALADATWRNGAFEVRRGASYTVGALTTGRKAPVFFGPGGTQPGGRVGRMSAAVKDLYGKNHWTMVWKAKGLGGRQTWVLGVRVAGVMHRIPVRVVG